MRPRRETALTPLAHDWDRWPRPAAWLPDGSAVLAIADEDGASPVFRISVTGGGGAGQVTRLTADAAAYTDVVVAPDGRAAYALRSSYEFPAEAVRIDLTSGDVVRLPAPAERPHYKGSLERVETTAADGTRVPAYLALPEGASAGNPAPLLLWIHGGPLGSWNAWTWRWNPWLLVARGYAVLLPDPALSTGYGQHHIQRGWGEWGKAPFTDLMAITDAVVQRPDIDETRTAAMGGSFGGYMANWVAGHTDRFKAIVTHASLWALDQFGPTTDAAQYWLREMTAEMALENSPHLHVENISTPMLVIHGDKDYRVPIGEGLRLWYELLSKSQLAADENGDNRAPLPLLPGRKPLDPAAAARQGLVRRRGALPRQEPARQGSAGACGAGSLGSSRCHLRLGGWDIYRVLARSSLRRTLRKCPSLLRLVHWSPRPILIGRTFSPQ